MFKNVASQSVTVLAIDTATNLPKTGDAANITLYYNGDGGGVTVFSTGSGHPSEDDATNSPGTYTIAMTQGETNFNRVSISGKSSTSGIRVVPILNIQTVAPNFNALVITSGGIAQADLQTIKTQTVTCAAGVTVGAFVGNATAALGVDASGRVDVGKILGTASAGVAGYVGIDWSHVNAPTTTVGLTGTTIATTQQVDVNTIKTQTVTCAAGVTVLASVGTAATSTAQTGDNFARIGAAGAGLTALGDTRIAHLDADVSSRMATYTQPTGFLAATFPSGTVANTTNITAGTITTVSGNVSGNVAGSVASVTAAVTVDGTSALTESYSTGAVTLAQGIYEILQVVGQFSIAGTTLTVQKRDKSTTAGTFTLNDATSPTSRTRAT